MPALLKSVTPVAVTPVADPPVANPTGPGAKRPRRMSRTSTIALFSIAGLFLASIFAVQKFAESEIETILRAKLASEGNFGPLSAPIAFADVNVSLLTLSIALNDVVATFSETDAHPSDTVKIKSLRVGGLDLPSLWQIAWTRRMVIPRSIYFEINGARLSTNLLGAQAKEFFSSMGQSDLLFSIHGALARGTTNFDVQNLEIQIDSLGQAAISLSLGHLNFPSAKKMASLKKDPKSLMSSNEFAHVTLRSFDLRFKDESFVERASSALVKMGEMKPLDLANLALRANSSPSGTIAANMDFVYPALQTWVRFLGSPSSLRVTAHPEKEIEILSLFEDHRDGSINEFAHQLGLSLK